MNSKTPNSSSQKSFSRDELKALIQNPVAYNERELDDFEKDALQGWEKASGGIELMEQVDHQFTGRFKPSFLLFSSLAIIILVAATYFFPANKLENLTTQRSAFKSYTQPKTFSHNRLEEQPVQKQIHAKQLVHTFKHQRTHLVSKTNPTIYVDENDDFVLPLRKINTTSSLPIVKLEKKTAKEIYVYELKIIDYRSYRSRTTAPNEQRLLTGTAANHENPSFSVEQFDWKPLEIPYHEYISETMELFKSGNFKQTMNRTKSILKFYPDDINALFYGGLCYYNLNQMNAAIDAFKKVLENRFQNFDEEASWYLANAYLANQDRNNAKATMEWIVEQNGFYANQAEKMLKKIN